MKSKKPKKPKNKVALSAETQHKIDLVKSVVISKLQADKVYDELHKIMGLEPESLLSSALFDPITKLITLTEALIGDDSSWISWFVWDNECGKRGLEASWMEEGRNGKLKKMKKRIISEADLIYVTEKVNVVDVSRKP